MASRQELIKGVEHAIEGEWESAHKVAQSDAADRDYCWLHACLHKIEGDEGNARYWYRRANRTFDPALSVLDELATVIAQIER